MLKGNVCDILSFSESCIHPLTIVSTYLLLYIIVYVEWASRVNFVTIFGDLYQNNLWVICNNLNQFAHLSSASGPSNDVIKMAAIVLLMYTYKTSYFKQYMRENLLLEMIFRLYLTNWTSNNTKKMCSIFFRRLESILGSQIDKFDPDPITFVVIL